MFSYSSRTSARCVPGTSHCKSAFIASAHKTTNCVTTLSTDTIVVLLLVLTFSYLVYSRTYSFPDFFADLRAIIYGETFKGFSSSASTSDIEKSRERARAAFARYGSIALAEAQEKRKALNTLTREHRRVVQDAGYSKKLELLDNSVRINTVLTNGIANATFGAVDSPANVRSRSRLSVAVGSEEVSRVREAMKHFVRDWSQEGEEERVAIFTPVLQAVRRWMSQECDETEGDRDVLVPGCGLARLAWEVNRLGLRTTALELSPYMSLAFRFLASPATTQSPHQHRLHPYAYWFSHQRSNESLFRTVTFPDVVPRTSSTFTYVEGDFLTHMYTPPISPSPSADSLKAGYSCIITLFFIDTSPNVLSTLQQIYRLLHPGGIWINLGPLLWPVEAKLEPCLEEVWNMCRSVGFEPADGEDGEDSEDSTSEYRGRRVPCEYTRDKGAMMRWLYEAEFWVMKKPL